MLKTSFSNSVTEAGLDEAGRGCLAGPVFAAAVMLPINFYHPLLNDSKKVSEKNRNELRQIIEKNAIAFSVANCSHTEIDTINILRASHLAMHRAIDGLSIIPKLLLIDGNSFNPYKKIKHRCIVKGDATYASIAAASILAKTYRDDYMMELHKKYPEYGWNKNKAYATVQHVDAILKYGFCEHHRKSFHLKKFQTKLVFDNSF